MEHKINELLIQRASIDAQLAELNIQNWNPKGGYYYITSNGWIDEVETSEQSRNFGTERETEEEAEQAIEKMKIFNRLLAYKDEFDPGYIFTPHKSNYYVYLDRREDVWHYGNDTVCENPTSIYFSSKELVEDLIKKLHYKLVTL